MTDRQAGARPPADRPDRRPPIENRPTPGDRPNPTPAAEATPLSTAPDLETINRRWHEIQAAFVDTPRQAVKDADVLVQELMNRLAQQFATERGRLEALWSHGDQASTEELRVALQQYRTFFQRLLSVR
jgi:hypothetical protein